jgi:EAL domain-containing protein (putative c-di-GMP-specific phosphodiesterase class I)
MRTASADRSWQADVERLLALTHRHLGMDVAWLSTFTDGRQVIVAATGDTAAMNVTVGDGTALDDAYCVRVLTGALPGSIADARRDLVTRDLPVTRDLNIGSYVGVPWHRGDGSPAGMLCCVSRNPGPQLDVDATRFLAFIADVLTEHLSSDLLAERHTSDRTSELIDAVLRAEAVQTVFQPVVRLGDGVVVAYEALSRFAPDAFGSPDAAFAAAARCGRGPELELLAARRALRHRCGLPAEAWIGLNLSADALLTPAVQDLLLAHADRRIGVELTEHSPVPDYARLTAVTERLRAAGVQIVVDDAGAGYAGLKHILLLRPNTIKLDVALVRDIDTDPVKAALARSLVAFAQDIGATLVAEGIETCAEHEALRGLGVGYGQGFLLARPGPLPGP